MSHTAAPRGLVGALVALALMIQALCAMPLAMRMAADASWLAQLGASLCTADHGSAPLGEAPAGSQTHDHCLICHGPAPLCAAATAALVLLAVLFARRLAIGPALACPAPQTLRFRPYRSRAPPLAA